MFHSSQEGLNQLNIHFDDFPMDITVCLIMGHLDSFQIRRVKKTKGGVSLFIEPVGYEFAAVPILNLDVSHMPIRYWLPRETLALVSIHVNWHVQLFLLLLLAGLD